MNRLNGWQRLWVVVAAVWLVVAVVVSAPSGLVKIPAREWFEFVKLHPEPLTLVRAAWRCPMLTAYEDPMKQPAR